jgi:hypothetical protein
MLRQRYERMLDIALTAQNLFDDVASFLERLQVCGWICDAYVGYVLM